MDTVRTVRPPDDLSRSLRQSWDDNAADWVRFAREPGHDAFFWHLGLPVILEMLPPPGRLAIDLGCGEGRLTRILRDRGYQIIGFDGSPSLVRAAATHAEAASVAVADAAALPVRANAADLVVAYMSLHDIEEMEAAVTGIARVLGGGGRFCAALVHPVQSAGSLGDPIVDGVRVTDDRGDAELTINDYFTSRRTVDTIERDGIRMTFHSEHRPLERYVRAFEAAGLLIESIREPVPDPEMIARAPTRARWTRIPWGLFVRAIRAPWARSTE
jgi:SAM-dependent methyltransferase